MGKWKSVGSNFQINFFWCSKDYSEFFTYILIDTLLNSADSFTACIGSFGVNCSFSCPKEYFGHGCQGICNCNNTQTCDPKIGCVARNYGIEPWFLILL